MFYKNKIKVKAILDADLENVLKQTKQYEEIIAGNIYCKNCNIAITIQNIGIIIPKIIDSENTMDFYCERIDCIEKYTKENGN